MRLGGRIAAAIEVIDDIQRRHRPAADALKDWGLSHRFAGAGDRGAIGNIVYDALRRRRSASWMLGDDTSRAAAFGAILLEWNETPANLNAALEGDRFAPEPLSASEIAAVASRSPADAPEAVRSDCPDWTLPSLERAFGDEWPAEGEALATRPPLDLRVNTLKADRPKVIAELQGTGADASPIVGTGVRIPPIDGAGRHPNVQAEPAFQKGWFEVQDVGSQVVAALAAPEQGAQVLDFCAGAGGKTLALSAAMDNRGQIFAYDSEKPRLAPIFDRLRRADCRNVQVLSRATELDQLAGRMDLVLVDAPCTGSGTWRRRPDAKWRLTARQLESRRGEQRAILDDAARHVGSGGTLAYITCSVFREENHDQVAEFLSRHGDFTVVDPAAGWEKAFPGMPGRALLDPLGIALTPRLTGTDGFFFAALRRAG